MSTRKMFGALTLAAMVGLTACPGDQQDDWETDPAVEPAPAPAPPADDPWVEEDPMMTDTPAVRDTPAVDDDWDDDADTF